MQTKQQELFCAKHGLTASPVCAEGMLGISRDFDPSRFPINGLRHRLEGETCGWYIWSGEEWSDDADFFVPVHASHLLDICSDAIEYLGLPPGWRFLFAPGHEDVWTDAALMEVP